MAHQFASGLGEIVDLDAATDIVRSTRCANRGSSDGQMS